MLKAIHDALIDINISHYNILCGRLLKERKGTRECFRVQSKAKACKKKCFAANSMSKLQLEAQVVSSTGDRLQTHNYTVEFRNWTRTNILSCSALKYTKNGFNCENYWNQSTFPGRKSSWMYWNGNHTRRFRANVKWSEEELPQGGMTEKVKS